MALAILSGWRRRLFGGRLRLAVAVASLITVGVGGYWAARYIEAFILLSSVVGAHNFEKDAVKNGRGDTVSIRTDVSERWQDTSRTVLRLRRAHHWFSTTLLEADSFGVQENLKWVNDDRLEVTLGFGCLTRMTHPIERVGAIHIAYRFRDHDKMLAKGCPD